MKPKSQKDKQDLLDFLGLAYDDYLAARLLLLNDLLPQGAQQAATAVEKIFKALILAKGNRCRGHLEQNLINNVKNKYADLYYDLNDDFIKFLRKAYKLRYYDDKNSKFSLVINQYRTLAELDILMHKVDSGFHIIRNNVESHTPYRESVKNKASLLMQDNHVLLEINKYQYFQRENRVHEIMVAPDFSGMTATYTTVGVNDVGSFLKPVDLSSNKKKIQLTFG